MAEWPIRVNITEEDFWAPYDSSIYPSKKKGGNVMDWASDNAWDDFKNLDKNSWVGYLDDLVTAFITKTKAKKITPYDLGRLYEALQKNPNAFESIRQAFMDAATWAWEEAYTPSDRDLEKALEYAKDQALGEAQMGDYWRIVLKTDTKGPKDWSPLKTFTEKQVLEEMDAGISFAHKEGEWDRFVVFDLMSGPAMKHVRRMLKSRIPDEDGQLMGPVPMEDFERDIKDQFVDPTIFNMGKALEKVREGVDLGYRVDFDPHWKSVLKDKSRAKGVQEEILTFLKDHPADEEEGEEA